MDVPGMLTDYLMKHYPRPRVDPEWLHACYQWVIADKSLNPATQINDIVKEVEEQLLSSNLQDSMLHGTGLPVHIPDTTVKQARISGPPVLVEIISLTDIGVSAYNLNKIRTTRDDRLAAGEEEEGEGDVDIEGEGPIPNYPRSMLSMELSDGATTLKAMEYRNIPGLRLGSTPLGFKLALKDCKVRRGIALLEPRCVTLKNHSTEDREVAQRGDFARHLHLRLGLEIPEVDMAEPPLAPPARSPLREIVVPRASSPELHDHMDDEDQPRRRRVPEASYSGATLVNTTQTSSFFDGPTQVDGDLLESLPLSPAGLTSRVLFIDSDDDTRTNNRVQGASSDFGDDDFFNNEEVWAAADETQSRGVPVSGPSSSTVDDAPSVDDEMIIDISDDDKENMPVPTRHVRRRVNIMPVDEADVDIIELSD